MAIRRRGGVFLAGGGHLPTRYKMWVWGSVALIPKICFDIDIYIDILIFKNFDIDIDNIKLINLTLILILIFDILITHKILL